MGQRSCVVPGCDRPHFAKSYCNPHYRRWRRHGDPGRAAIQTQRAPCTVDGCDDQQSARGYCAGHYARWRRNGNAGDAFTVRRRDPAARDDQDRKQCRVCDEWLAESVFHAATKMPDGLAAHCKQCHYATFIARTYGVDISWYAETLARQGGGCAVCGTPPNGRRLHVDHDHAHCAADRGCRECVRGLLCSPCNTGIGLLAETPERLRAAAAYLESWREQQ